MRRNRVLEGAVTKKTRAGSKIYLASIGGELPIDSDNGTNVVGGQRINFCTETFGSQVKSTTRTNQDFTIRDPLF